MYTDLKLSNYYGTLQVFKENDKFYIKLDNWNTPDIVEISEKLYKLLIKELKFESEGK
jgi:hypothetical protein